MIVRSINWFLASFVDLFETFTEELEPCKKICPPLTFCGEFIKNISRRVAAVVTPLQMGLEGTKSVKLKNLENLGVKTSKF